MRRPTKGPFVAALVVVTGAIVWSFYRRTEHLAATKPEMKFACKTDVDCTNSCSQGAVSKTWLAAHNPPECADGCNNQLTAPARCIQGECVAFAFDPHGGNEPRRNDSCTKIPAEVVR